MRNASSRSPSSGHALRRVADANVKNSLPRAKLFACIHSEKYYFSPCPNSHVPVDVCRSVGSGTRGPPAAWRGRQIPSKKSDRQPEAKPANPALSRGRVLKQRRSGFSGLCRPSKSRRGVTEEACSSCRPCGAGLSPFQAKAAYERVTSVTWPARIQRVQPFEAQNSRIRALRGPKLGNSAND